MPRGAAHGAEHTPPGFTYATGVPTHDVSASQPGARAHPARIEWPDAPTHLLSLARAMPREKSRPVVIGVTGPVGSGKSALASRLSPCVLATDDYLPDYDKVAYHERDDPRMADFARLHGDLSALLRGEPARAPVWSFKTHRREGERYVAPSEVVVCEGIHALHESIHRALDLAVFVEAPSDVRWRRWEHLELTGVRGMGVEAARAFFRDVAEPTFERFAAAYRSRAHVIVTNGAGITGLT